MKNNQDSTDWIWRAGLKILLFILGSYAGQYRVLQWPTWNLYRKQAEKQVEAALRSEQLKIHYLCSGKLNYVIPLKYWKQLWPAG